MLKKIKKAIPKTWIIKINSLRFRKQYENTLSKDELKVFVMLAADYGNLGDVAITEAQKSFLQKTFPKYHVIEVPISDTYKNLGNIKKICSSQDIITLIGGGNMGDIYEDIEERRRTVISYFPENKIVSFPQTIDFSDSELGEKSLKKSIEVYSNHNNLKIFARETISYNLMKELFPKNNVNLVPDIVLSLDNSKPQLKREGIVFSLRDDKESRVKKNEKEMLIDTIKEKYENVKFYDTHIGDNNFISTNASLELENIWKAFKEAKVVITDRLHGMIFCAITNTPCIVMPNSNHKIIGSYNNWLNTIPNIKLIQDFDIEKIELILDH